MSSGVLTAPRTRRMVMLLAAALALGAVGAMWWFGSPSALFLPLGLLLIPVFGMRLLTRPAWVIGVFLLVAVNLDFIKFADRAISLDVILSAVLIWAILLRLGLTHNLGLNGRVQRMYVAFLLVTAISVVLSISPGVSFKNWARDLQYLVMFALLVSLPLERAQVRGLVAACIASSFVPCVLGLAGMLFGITEFYGEDTPVGGGELVTRINGTLSHPVVFSHYLSLMCTITLAFILGDRSWPRRLLVPLFLLQLTVLYFTFGRTGWVELMVASVALLWMLGRRKVLFAGSPLVLIAMAKFLPTFLSRWEDLFSGGGQNSFVWRLGLWAYSLTRFPERPFFGSGQDTFLEYINYQTGYASHQTWIGLLIETGAVGMLAFLILILVVGRDLSKRRRGLPADALVCGVSAAWIGHMVGSLAGDPFGLPSVAVYFWALLALALHPTYRKAEWEQV